MARSIRLVLAIWQEPHDVVIIAVVTLDDRFRYILMLGLLALMGIMVFHRLRARTGEKLDRRQEGLFSLVALRLVALAGMIALVAYFRNPANLAFSAMPLPDWLRWPGVGVGCMTLCLLFWTLRSLGKNLTDCTFEIMNDGDGSAGLRT